MISLATSLTAAVLAAAPTASVSAAAPGDAYCAYVEHLADADSALLTAPDLIGSVGLVNAGSEITGDEDVGFETSARLTLGLRYDFIGLYRGLATQDVADADCSRYRALQALDSFLAEGRDVGAAEAAKASLAVLEELLPQAEERLKQVRDEVEQGRAGIEELNATQLRVADLRERAADARLVVERTVRSNPVEGSLPELRRAYLQADAALEEAEADVREASAWELGVRGGYDQVVGVDQELPIFAVLTVGWSFGQPFQLAAHRRAEEARREWISTDDRGAGGRVNELLVELQAVRKVEEERLRQAEVLLADVQARLAAVEDLESSRLRRFASALWFEQAQLRVETTGLRARLDTLERLLGSQP